MLGKEKHEKCKRNGLLPVWQRSGLLHGGPPDGAVTQLSTVGEKRSAYINAQAGISKIFAVWPGRWRSDLFIIDDLDAFSEKQSLFGKYR